MISFVRAAIFLRRIRFRMVVRFVGRRNGFVPGARRFLAARVAERLLRTRLLDAPERAAKLIQFALIGGLLALGLFDEPQHVFHLFERFFQRADNPAHFFGGLTNGGNVGRTKIGRLLSGPRR
jgi:hypothetical protein